MGKPNSVQSMVESSILVLHFPQNQESYCDSDMTNHPPDICQHLTHFVIRYERKQSHRPYANSIQKRCLRRRLVQAEGSSICIGRASGEGKCELFLSAITTDVLSFAAPARHHHYLEKDKQKSICQGNTPFPCLLRGLSPRPQKNPHLLPSPQFVAATEFSVPHLPTRATLGWYNQLRCHVRLAICPTRC